MTNPANREIPLTTALPHFFDRQALLADIEAVLDSRWLTNRGPMALRLEKEIQQYLGNPSLHVVSCANATVAAELVLKAWKLKGKAIVTPYTFVATVHALVNVGLEPVFADIDPETLCLDPRSVEKLMDRDVSVVCPVHVYGNVCDLEYFESLRSRGTRVLYDSAHAFGVRTAGNKAIGAFGDAETFSLHATKILNACEGGIVATLDEDLARKVTLMTNFGFTGETSVELVGTNSKLSEVHAVFGLHSLKNLPEAMRIRASLVARYRALLKELPAIRVPAQQAGVSPNSQYMPVFFRDEKTRDSVYEFLKARQILARKYFYPLVHKFAPYRHTYANASVPVAEAAAATVLCLPLHSLMQEKDVDEVVDAISLSLK